MPYKQNPKSPILKALVGKQHRLPQHLQDAIKAAPESPAKMYNSPAKAMAGPGVPKEANKTGTAGSTPKGNLRDRSKPPGASGTPKQAKKVKPTPKPAPAAPKPVAKKPAAKSKYDKELNSLVSQRKGLKKGTAEYNRVQNRINEKLGSKVRRSTIETTKVKAKPAVTTAKGAQLKKVVAPAKPAKKTVKQKIKGAVATAKANRAERRANDKTIQARKALKAQRQEKRAERRANDKTIQARKAAKAQRQSKRADRLEARAAKLRK